MNYLLDGRCEISNNNNAAERRAKSYATGRKNFLFHDSVDGAKATAIVMSLVETARANNLNPFKYLYTLLLYMPNYKNEPTSIEQLMPWSEFVQIRCSGINDDNLVLPETRGNLPIYGFLVRVHGIYSMKSTHSLWGVYRTSCSLMRVQRHMQKQETALCSGKEIQPSCQSRLRF